MRNLRVIGILTMVAIGMACSGGEPEPAAEATVYQVRGMFARAEDNGAMTVRHEEIPGYMASMTMPFKVEDASMLEGLEYGDKIEFELVVDADGGSIVRSVAKLPEDTVLSFESD